MRNHKEQSVTLSMIVFVFIISLVNFKKLDLF